jgi:hypothetical protein
MSASRGEREDVFGRARLSGDCDRDCDRDRYRDRDRDRDGKRERERERERRFTPPPNTSFPLPHRGRGPG